MCYGLLPTFPLLSTSGRGEQERKREGDLNVNLTDNWSAQHGKTLVVYSLYRVPVSVECIGWEAFFLKCSAG